jgi:ferredoxin-NADP reductase
VGVTCDDYSLDGKKPYKRAFSIASSPYDKEFIELCVARGPHLSAHLLDLAERSEVNVEGPYGQFILNQPIPDNLVFIAGGTGIAPIRSMIRTLVHEKFDKNFWLFFSIRYPEDYIYKAELEEYAQKFKNFHLVVTCTCKENHAAWKGERGRVTELLLKYIPSKIKPAEVYLCGPPAMVDDTTKVLRSLGVTKLHIDRWE